MWPDWLAMHMYLDCRFWPPVDEEREKLDARMEAREARLRSQFLYNDAIIQTLNSTLDFVQQQFDAMNGNNDN